MGVHRLVPHHPLAVDGRQLNGSLVDHLLGRAAVILTTVLSIVFVATLTMITWPRAAPTEVSPYRPGATIDTPVEWHESSAYTLVLFARSSCEACQTAAPFFRELVRTVAEKHAVVFVTSRAEHEIDTAFASGLGLDSAAVKQAVPGLRVRVTPTLVLVNRQGTIIEAWEGVGPDSNQAAIRNAILRVIAS